MIDDKYLRALRLLADLVDPDDCSPDPGGGCGTHRMVFAELDGCCPHRAAKELLATEQREGERR